MNNRIEEIIRESISRVLSDDSVNAKNRTQKHIINAFRKGKSGYQGIRTIAVFTSSTPDLMTAQNDVNLRKLHKLLKGANYVTIPLIDQWEGQKEYSCAVINISRESAARYCGQYQQAGFVFYELEDDPAVKCECWEKEEPALPYHPGRNNYVKKEEAKEIIETPNSEDDFSKTGKDCKYSAVFECINESICRNLNVMIEKGFGGHNNPAGTIIDFSIYRKGQSPHIYRGQLYKGLL